MDQYKRMKQRTAGAVLTEAEVARIKMNLKTRRLTARDIADAYMVALSTIQKIARGDTWAWVEAEVDGTELKVEEDRILASLTPEARAELERENAQVMANLRAMGLVPEEATPTPPVPLVAVPKETSTDAVNRILREANELRAKQAQARVSEQRLIDELTGDTKESKV